MRIGFDAKRFFNNSSGLGNYSRQLISDLALFGPKDMNIHLFHSKQMSCDFPLHSPEIYNPFWRTWGMGKSASIHKMDVFHGLSNEIPFDLPKNIYKIVTIHDVIFKQFPQHYPFVDRFIYNKKTKVSLDIADKIIVTSEATQEQLNAYYKVDNSKVEIVYQAVAQPFYLHKASLLNSEKYFIYISSFTKRKNHLNLIEAFNLIKNQHQWNLKLVGLKGEMSLAIHQKIKDLDLGSRIEVIENADQSEMIKFLQNASAFVYPSIFEGFGIPLAEAVAIGLPMAVSDISVFKELAENSAFYFNPSIPMEIAEQMLKLTHLESSKLQLSFRGSVLNKINSERIVNQLIKIYTK